MGIPDLWLPTLQDIYSQLNLADRGYTFSDLTHLIDTTAIQVTPYSPSLMPDVTRTVLNFTPNRWLQGRISTENILAYFPSKLPPVRIGIPTGEIPTILNQTQTSSGNAGLLIGAALIAFALLK